MNPETSAEQLGRAIKLASFLHNGQIDKSGEPYILHPLAVMSKCAPIHDIMMVAVLHDIIEDCDFVVPQLRSMRFPENVCDGVEAMTRHVIENKQLVCRKVRSGEKKEKYNSYIQRLSKNPIACIVKFQDIEHNLSPERCSKLDLNESLDKISKYRKAQFDLYPYFHKACLQFYGKII